MPVKNMKKETLELAKIVKALKENASGLWIREISRRCEIHPEIVRRLLNKYSALFEEYADFTIYKINLKIFKLKNPDLSNKALGNYIKLKNKIK
jgi:hypothetical protein